MVVCMTSETFPPLLTFLSETSLEKLSQLNGLLNNGNQWGNLRHVRKHQSYPAVPFRWLARKFFFWPVRSRQFKSFWNWFGKSKCPGAHLNLTVNFHYKHSIIPTSCPCLRGETGRFANESFRQRSFRKRLWSVRKRVEVSSQTLCLSLDTSSVEKG